jgi:hypothetical protein
MNIDAYLEKAFPICMAIPRQKKHCSLVFHKNRLISVGCNRFKTHPQAKKIGYQYEEMHSEFDAYRKVPKNLCGKKLHLVNIRFNKEGELRMAKPCELCLPWCMTVFQSIKYTTDEGILSL